MSSQDLQYEAEKILSNEGTKAISKCIAVGNINTALFQEIARLAQARGIRLRVKDSINKYMNFPPLIRSLHTIFADLRYDNDFLMYSAVREQLIPTIEYLLMDGLVDPLCRNGECITQAYVQQSNMTLTRMLLDHLRDAHPEIPLPVLDTAVDRKDFSFIRYLLTKGVHVTAKMMDTWLDDKENRDWMLMRLYLRFSNEFVIPYRDQALARLCLDTQDVDEKEKENRRDMFSLLMSYNMDVASLIQQYSDPTKVDQFTYLMMSEQSRGLYHSRLGSNQAKSGDATKKKRRKVVEEIQDVREVQGAQKEEQQSTGLEKKEQ